MLSGKKMKECLLGITILMMFSISAAAQKWEKVYPDTNNYSVHPATIGGKKYLGFINSGIFHLLNSKGDTILKRASYYYDFEFHDFNKDGHLDILLFYANNTPSEAELFEYLPSTGKFKEVENFGDFPAPEPIKGTKFYYSYHHSGCADMDWDSDLFYIENFKAIRIGNISGRQCGGRYEKDAIYIHKVYNHKEKLFKTLPIETISRYKDYKWGFIRDYWTKNYKLFVR